MGFFRMTSLRLVLLMACHVRFVSPTMPRHSSVFSETFGCGDVFCDEPSGLGFPGDVDWERHWRLEEEMVSANALGCQLRLHSNRRGGDLGDKRC